MLGWKSVKKIDGHIHIVPDEIHKGQPGFKDAYSKAKLETYLEIMERYNIEKAVIMPFNDPIYLAMQFKVREVHENLLKFKKEYPDRFYIFADIDPFNTASDSLKYVEEAIEKYGFDGLKLHPTNSGFPIDSDYNRPLLEYAQKRGICVCVHSYPDASDDLCSVSKIRRVLKRYPKLKMMVSHMGYLEFEELLHLNCYVDMSAVLPDYAKTFGLKKTNEILRSFKIDRLVFASNWPFSRIISSEEVYDDYMKILDYCNFNDEEIHKIAYQNIKNFLEGK